MMRNCENKSLPKSYILENFYDSVELKKDFDESKIYILKKNEHRKKGLKLFRGKYNNLKNEYLEGGFKVIQEFIENPYLLNDRILVIRMYLVIKKYNHNYDYYIHNYGKCLYTSKNFSLKNLEEERLITDNKTLLDDTFPKYRRIKTLWDF